MKDSQSNAMVATEAAMLYCVARHDSVQSGVDVPAVLGVELGVGNSQ